MKPSLFTSLVLSVFLIASCNSNENSHFVRFEGEAYGQKWAVQDLNPDLPADWSDYGYLTFDFNASSAQRFNIDLYDAQGRRTLVLNPFQGAWVRASIPLSISGKDIRRARYGFDLENSPAGTYHRIHRQRGTHNPG
jgi:hypothetical protein